MKLLNTLLLLCAALAVAESDAPASCYTTKDDGTIAKTTCPDGDITNCKSPTWTPYVGYATSPVEYAKFACTLTADDDKCNDDAANCVVCETDDIGDNCNKPQESTDLECYKWKYESNEWKKDGDATVCKITDEVKKMCNVPNRETAKSDTYTASLNGCGPCSVITQFNAKTCLECDNAECNGSAFLSVSVLLAALSAIVYLV